MKKQAIILMIFLSAIPVLPTGLEKDPVSITENIDDLDTFFAELEHMEAPPLPPQESYWMTPYVKEAFIRAFLVGEKACNRLAALYAACPSLFSSPQ